MFIVVSFVKESLLHYLIFPNFAVVPSAGSGIYAGKNYQTSDLLGLSYSLIIDSYLIEDLKLIGYVFTPYAGDHYYSLILFGPALMFNHMKSQLSNTQLSWNFDIRSTSQSVSLRPYSIYPSLSFQTRRTIRAGEELTFTYGDKEYFQERNISLDFGSKSDLKVDYLPSELEKVGHCLSGIVVQNSTLPMAGKGVFATKKFETGSLVSVSPVLVVPKHVATRGGRGSVLLNYLLSVEGTDVGLLPVGTAGMINHGREDYGEANVELRWFDWNGRDVMEMLETMDVERELIGSKSAQLYLGYHATRPISRGDELLMSYGSSWERAWRSYLDLMAVWFKARPNLSSVDLLSSPQFRHPIALSPSLYPQKWLNENHRCLSSRDCRSPYDARRPDLVQQRFNRKQVFHFDQDSLTAALDRWSVCNENNSCTLSSPVTVRTKELSFVESECSLYLHPIGTDSSNKSVSSSVVTLGVFAGTSFQSNDAVDLADTHLFHSNSLVSHSFLQSSSTLAVHKNFATLIVGIGSMFRKSSTMFNTEQLLNARDRLVHVPYPQIQSLRPYSLQTEMIFIAKKALKQGQEITIKTAAVEVTPGGQSSGGSKRGNKGKKHLKEPKSVPIEKLKANGLCLSHLYVNISTLPLAGKGVFTHRHFQTNDLVTVSPVLVLPKHLFVEDESSVLSNYLLSVEGTDVGLLPVGTAGMINHGREDYGEANVELRWFDWNGRDVMEMLETMDVERELIGSKSAQLYLGYHATRPISRGDELLMFYGSSWERAWGSYLDLMAVWFKAQQNPTSITGDDLLSAPQFRHSITLPSHLIPFSFRNTSLRRCVEVDEDFWKDCHLRPQWIHDQLQQFHESTRLDLEVIQSAATERETKTAEGARWGVRCEESSIGKAPETRRSNGGTEGEDDGIVKRIRNLLSFG